MKYVFVTGAGRCGTNLVNGILDGHSKLNVFPGEITNLIFHTFVYNNYSLNFKDPKNAKIIIDLFLKEKLIKNKSEKKIKIIKNLKSKQNFTLQELLDEIFLNLYKSKKINVINIQNENIKGVLENFKDCKIIHMLRNPYTQINSRYLFRHKNPVNYSGTDFSESFKRNFISFQQATIFKKNKNVKIIKMENLVDYPDKFVNKICNFIGVKKEKINLKLTKQNKIFKGTKEGLTNYSYSIEKYNNDFSCLLPNDLYYCSKIYPAKNFYKLIKYKKVNNSYVLFLLRQLGFIGNNRKVPKNIFKILKLTIHSIYNYIADRHIKNEFDNFLKENTFH